MTKHSRCRDTTTLLETVYKIYKVIVVAVLHIKEESILALGRGRHSTNALPVLFHEFICNLM